MVAWDGKFGDGDKFVIINYFFIYNKNKLFHFILPFYNVFLENKD